MTRKIAFTTLLNKTTLKFGFISALVIIVFQIANHLVIYNYLKLDVYLSLVALIFLAVGVIIKEGKEIVKEIPVEIIKEIEVVIEVSVNNVKNDLEKLTNRELEILKLITQGKSNKEIAELNFVEISTIKTHINNIYAKLSIKNRREACLKYSNTALNHFDS